MRLFFVTAINRLPTHFQTSFALWVKLSPLKPFAKVHLFLILRVKRCFFNAYINKKILIGFIILCSSRLHTHKPPPTLTSRRKERYALARYFVY